MKTYTANDLKVAVALTSARPRFPFLDAPELSAVLNDASAPALDDMPSHLNCEVVKYALQTMFIMGVACGIELERGS
jgi:hypothetical protein